MAGRSYSWNAATLQERRAGWCPHSRVLPATDDHAWDHHGLLRADHRAAGGFRQLFPAHPSGRRGHAVSAPQHAVVLGDLRRIPGGHRRVFRAPGATSIRLDGVRPTKCAGRGCRAGTRDRPGPVGGFDCHLLRGAVVRHVEFHLGHAGYALPGHGPHAPSTHRVGMVYHCLHQPDSVRGLDAGLHPAGPGPRRRNQLLRTLQPGRQRSVAAARGRIDPTVAAPVLVLRAPGGLHCDRARHGHCLSRLDHQHAPAAAQPQSDYLFDGRNRVSQLHGLWTSHVRQRDESVLVNRVFLAHAGDYYSVHDHGADLDRQSLRFEAAY